MSREVRVMAEGTLRGVFGSGSGHAWQTGAGAAGYLYAFVESFSFNSGQEVVTVMERGVPHHHKVVGRSPIEATFRAKWTGQRPFSATGVGATVPVEHLEWRVSAVEMGAGSSLYYQFFGGALQRVNMTEGKDGNTIELQYRFLGMNGPTASGYLG